MLEIKKQEVERVRKEYIDVGVFTCDRCGVKALALGDGMPYFEVPHQWTRLKYEGDYYQVCPACTAKPINLTSEVFNARKNN